jgi:predicted esterase
MLLIRLLVASFALLCPAWLFGQEIAVNAQASSPGRPGTPAIDVEKHDAWRFLDDDLGGLLDRASAAYAKGDHREAAGHYLAYLYRNGRDARAIYNLARCYARMGNAAAAVDLLARAARNGFVHPELLQSDEDLKPIRETRSFKDHHKKVAALGERLGASIGVIAPRVNRCRVRLPPSRVPGKAYPLVIGLHGNGGDADGTMQALTPEALPGMICAAPEGPYPRDDLSWQPGGHYGWFLLTPDKALWRALDAPTSDYILAVIDEVSKRCPVSKVVLLGFSQGVSAAYLAALRQPERIDGVVAFSGTFPDDELTPEEIKAGNRIKVLIGHGTADPLVGLAESERARDRLRAAGYQVQFEAFEGGHAIPPDLMRLAGEWMRGWLTSATAR